MGRNQKTSLAIRLLTILIPLIVGLLLIEATLRLMGHGPITPHDASYQFDQTLGWRPIPSRSVERIGGQYRSRIRYNERGFRGPSIQRKAKERILILGDSFTEAYQLNWEQTFVGRLQNAFANEGRNLEVLNLGVAGYSTDQELLRYDRHAPDLAHQLVVLMFYASNDLAGNMKQTFAGYAKPTLNMAAVVQGRLEVTNAPSNAPPGKSRSLLKRSALATYVARRVLGSTWALTKLKRLGFAVTDISRPGTQLIFPAPPKLLDAYDRFLDITALLASKARNNNAKLLVVYVPSRLEANVRLYQDTLGSQKPFKRLQGETLFLQYCRQRKFDCISSLPTLQKSISAGRDCYFSRDNHWNAEGHRQIADLLRKEIAGRIAPNQ